jgi:putative PIN family toxin of toxin-antitoxin system
MVRAVFDTTIIVSALLTPSGLARALIERAKAEEFTLVLSQEIVDEYFKTLRTHKRLRKDYGYSDA